MKKQPRQAEIGPVRALRRAALEYPEAEEGVSCNKSAFKARNKAFLFVGIEDDSYNVMVKLGDSLEEAARLEAKEPGRYAVGGHGWVKATFGRDESAPAGLLERWIGESYRLLVHRELVALLPGSGAPPPARASRAAGKKRPKRRATSG